MRILSFDRKNNIEIDFETFFGLFAGDIDKTARDLSLICAKMRKSKDEITVNLRFEINHTVPSGKKTRNVVKIVGVEEMIKNGGYYDKDTFETILDYLISLQNKLYYTSNHFIQRLTYARQEDDKRYYAEAFYNFYEFIAAYENIIAGYRYIETFDPKVTRWICGISCAEAKEVCEETEGAIKI